MKVNSTVKFLGCERRAGFKDPTKYFNVVALADGLDVVRIYVDDLVYGDVLKICPYTDVSVVLDLKPSDKGIRIELSSIASASVKDGRQTA